MPGGETTFRGAFPNYASKIDNDPNLEAATKADFWSKVELCGAVCAGSDQCSCCASFEMQGSVVPLSAGERLGTTQKLMWVAVSIANQDASFTPPDVMQALAELEALPAAEGLAGLHTTFGMV